jgi:hypothetical protein
MAADRRQSTRALTMIRVSAMALLTCAPLLLPQLAAAQDCFCGAPPTFGIEAEVLVELAVPAPAETPDTTIESVHVVEAVPSEAPPTSAVLWCTSANDPRCMPMQSSDAPSFRALSGGPVAVAIEPTHREVWRVARELTSMTPAEELPPAMGVQRSIDRPPRG